MYKKILLALLFISAWGYVYSQALLGGAGICKTSGDPDGIVSMQTLDQRYECSVAWDTVNNVLYYYNPGASLGSRWSDYSSSLPGDNLGNHLATQNLDLDRNQVIKVDLITGGVGPGNVDNVGELDFNEDVGTGMVGNATVLSHNASILIASDQNGNATTASDEPIVLAQGSNNTDDLDYVELLRTYNGYFRILDAYNMATTSPPSNGDPYVQTWTNGINSWTNTTTFGGGGGIWEVENGNTLATDNTSNNYHEGNVGIGDFSSNTIGGALHIYDPALTVRLSDSCNTAQCATPQLEFYQGYNTSLLGRVGFLSSADNDFTFINNLATGRLKFGTDATVKLELSAAGQMRLNQYTSTSSFTGTAAGYLGFDSNGNIITTAGTGGGGTFLSLTDSPSSYTGEAGQYLRVNTGETGLEFVAAPSGGGGASYPTTNPSNTNLEVVIDLNEESTGIFTLIANSRTRYEVRDTNPPLTGGGHYTILFNSTSTDTISFHNDFKYSTGSNINSVVTTGNGAMVEFFYDGSQFFTDEFNNVNSISAPTCFDGVQNGDETGVDCGGSCPDLCGGGGSFDADYQAVLDYATTQGYTLPSSGQQDDQNQLVLDLKTAGVWDSLDVFYVFATDGDRDYALINWADPGTFDATEAGTMTFTADEGFTSDGSSGYLNTNLNLNTDSTSLNYGAQYGQIMAHINTTGPAWPTASAICGAREATSTTTDQLMVQNNALGNTIVRMQSYGNLTGSYEYLDVSPPGGTTGTFHYTRTSANNLAAYHNNSLDASDNTSDNFPDLPNCNVYLFANSNNNTAANFMAAELSMWAIGAFETQRTAVYNAWSDYATALGGL